MTGCNIEFRFPLQSSQKHFDERVDLRTPWVQLCCLTFYQTVLYFGVYNLEYLLYMSSVARLSLRTFDSQRIPNRFRTAWSRLQHLIDHRLFLQREYELYSQTFHRDRLRRTSPLKALLYEIKRAGMYKLLDTLFETKGLQWFHCVANQILPHVNIRSELIAHKLTTVPPPASQTTNESSSCTENEVSKY